MIHYVYEDKQAVWTPEYARNIGPIVQNNALLLRVLYGLSKFTD